MVRGKKSNPENTLKIESRISADEARRLAKGDFLTIEEVCQKLQICKVTLWKLTRKGQIPFLRIGRSKRYPKIAVEEYSARELQRVN